MRIFISYSSFDRQYVEDFQQCLVSCTQKNQVSVWKDHDIPIGADWAQAINHALESCNVAILFISQDFLASSYITETEVPKLLNRAELGEVVLAPVFVSASTVDGHSFMFEGADGDLKNTTLDRSIVGGGYRHLPSASLDILDENSATVNQ